MSTTFALAARITDHEMKVEQNIPSRQTGMAQPFHHCADGDRPHCRARLMDGGQRNRKEARILYIVDSRHADSLRHAHTQIRQCLEKSGSCEIVGANETLRLQAAQDGVPRRSVNLGSLKIGHAAGPGSDFAAGS